MFVQFMIKKAEYAVFYVNTSQCLKDATYYTSRQTGKLKMFFVSTVFQGAKIELHLPT